MCVRLPCPMGPGTLVPLAVLAPSMGGVVDPSGTRLTHRQAFIIIF
jgi:hypothetical protein